MAVALALCSTAAHAATRHAAPTVTAWPDSGHYTFLFGGQPAGGETFTLRREGEALVARTIGTISIGSAFALADTTRIELDRDLRPRAYESRAVANGTRSHVRIAFAPGYALIESHADTAGLTPDTTACADGAVLIPNNCFVAFALAALTAQRRGLSTGDVTLPVFGTSTLVLSRGAAERHGALRAWRHTLNLAQTVGGTLWLDDAGRLLKLALPLQNATVLRDGIDGIAALGDSSDVQRDTAHAAATPDAGGRWAEEVRLVSAGTPLGGTLLLPQRTPPRPVPAVLMLTGSGAQDRNEDSPGPGGIHFGIFRIIAERLAARGIATLRLDDRGVGASGGDFNTSTFSDEVGDARTALRFLRGRPDIDARRVAVLGHSEGAMIAMLLAGEDSALAAAALMAGPIQSFRDVIMAQTLDAARKSGATPAQLAETARAESSFIAVLERREPWTADNVPPQAMTMQSRRVWLEELVALDLVPSVKAIRCPVGIFQGGKDDQVRSHDAVVIDSLLAAAGKARHALHVFPRLNHLFIASRGGGIAEYADTRATVDAGFLDALARWCVATLQPASPHAKRRR